MREYTSARWPSMCCSPRSKRQPRHSAHRFAVAYGQSKLFERIGRATTTSIPPTASISSRKRSKSTNATWFTSSPVSRSTVRSARAGPPIWFAALILATPTSGISTWRSRGIDRKASRRFPGSVRMSMIESDRLAASRPEVRAAVGAEDEDRRRVRDQQPVGRRELPANTGRHALARPARRRSRPRGSPRPPTRRRARRSTRPSTIQRSSGSGVVAASGPAGVGRRPAGTGDRDGDVSRASGTRPLTRPPR